MAMWKLTKRVVLPVGAVVSVPFVVPMIYTEEPTNIAKLVKPKELPIYDTTQSKAPVVHKEEPESPLLKAISTVRKSIFTGVDAITDTKDRAVHFFEVGKAHTENTYNYLVAEENVVPRAVAITFGGLAGLLLAYRRGIFKKLLYTSSGIVGMSFVCYPEQATQVSQDVFKIGKYYAWLAYAKYQEAGTNDTVSTKQSPNTNSSVKKQDRSEKDKIPDQRVPAHSPSVPSKVVGDYGQSNVADKDLYTTRS